MKAVRLTLFYFIGAALLVTSYGAFFMLENDHSDAGNALHNKFCEAQGYNFLAALLWCILCLKGEPSHARGVLIAFLVILGFGMLVYK